jgi:hypothetical protein
MGKKRPDPARKHPLPRAVSVAALLAVLTVSASPGLIAASHGSASEAPTITGFAPASGPAGTMVTISGTNFVIGPGLGRAPEVAFNGVPPTWGAFAETSIVVPVPAGASSGPITVTTTAGTATSSSDFAVTPAVPPIISGFAPASGRVNAMVTISGSYLGAVTGVAFNGISARWAAVALSETEIIAWVPGGATTGPITVTSPGGTGQSSPFIVEPTPTPTIADFQPRVGPIGSWVTITGTDLAGVTDIAFNGTSASSRGNGAGSIVAAVVPAGATTGPITVTTAGGTATSDGFFTVSAGSGFYTVEPCRVLDTRLADGPYGGPALRAGETRVFDLAGRCGIPVGAQAVAVNITATQASAAGHLRLHPADVASSPTSTVNYPAGATRAVNSLMPVSPAGALAVYCGQASGTVHVVLDVQGYFAQP